MKLEDFEIYMRIANRSLQMVTCNSRVSAEAESQRGTAHAIVLRKLSNVRPQNCPA